MKQLLFFGSDLPDIKVRMALLVMSDQMCVTSEEFGALIAFRQFDRCAQRLSQNLLVRLDCLLLDFYVALHVD